MIALDTSAIIAVAFEEEDEATISRFIAKERSVVGTSTLVEVGTVLSRLERAVADRFLVSFLGRRSVTVVDFSFPMYEAAREAYRIYGKGQGHPAQLNFGDCMAYALAKVRGLPLLYKGDDFAHTDIEAAWRP